MPRFKPITVFSIVMMCCSSSITVYAKDLPKHSNDEQHESVHRVYADLQLQAKKNPSSVAITTSSDGWQVVYENKIDRSVIWSFTPMHEKAYPAFVRREITFNGEFDMHIVCEAKKQDCDDLFNTFSRMNIEAFGAVQ